MIDTLTSYIEELKTALDSENALTPATYDLDCTDLPYTLDEFNSGSTFITDIAVFYESPAVYWFDIESDHKSQDLYDYIAKQPKGRFPAFKKPPFKCTSRTLYVGKAKDNLAGRLRMHLGFEKTGQGLQLCHWPHKKGLKLKLNVIYLPIELQPLASVFELKVAQKLNPILGKHK